MNYNICQTYIFVIFLPNWTTADGLFPHSFGMCMFIKFYACQLVICQHSFAITSRSFFFLNTTKKFKTQVLTWIEISSNSMSFGCLGWRKMSSIKEGTAGNKWGKRDVSATGLGELGVLWCCTNSQSTNLGGCFLCRKGMRNT